MRIINVSYRLPVSFYQKEEVFKVKTSSGGLVSALLSFKDSSNELHWVGVADFTKSDFLQGQSVYQGAFELHPVFLNKEINFGFYNGFSNSVLWPLFHYFPTFVEFNSDYFECYRRANEIIAEKIVEIYKKDDLIWIHDYQLMPLASLIRAKIPEAKIGFFLHIPFPSYELLRILPGFCRDYLIRSLLGADLIGFHTYDYARHFLNSVQMIQGLQQKQFVLQYENRKVKIDVFPISIDFDKFDLAYSDPVIASERIKIKQLYAGKKIIFSVDRLDYTKGIVYRLKGFAEFLKRNPEWKERIVFLLIAVPSRTDIKRYKERKQMIELLISNINGQYGNTKWTPIVYQRNSVDFKELTGLYTSCDIALISPLRDGMNLVAKEFVASRHDEDGVLLLSDMTGAAKELTDAQLFNPLDETEIAEKIKEALEFSPQTRKVRMLNLRKQVRKYNVEHWSKEFVRKLEEACNVNNQPLSLSYERKNEVMEKFRSAKKRLLLLDYDGTLTGFKSSPEECSPDAGLIELLTRLGEHPQNHLVLVSGRDSATLDTWFGKVPMQMVAEHGAELKSDEWRSLYNGKISWKKDVLKIMERFAENTPGAFVEEKQYALCWHYRNSEEHSGYAQSRELVELLKDYLSDTGASVLDGNKVIEVKPISINKGDVIEKNFDVPKYDFRMAIGDDRTDEAMFEVLNQYPSATIKVGNASTVARYRVLTTQMVLSFLEQLSYV